ncbi:2'-5' RNA ligase family protein, partial [Escherichia coli]|uniref:2'-5' RNA ligase family protein n=1 Tax=Escherichia coli TaxID=562 RepID=UPI001C59ED4D
ELARSFAAVLTAQDRQGWRPHVTVQNKVTPETARALHADLAFGFTPFRFTAPGLLLWRYLGGPWAQRTSFVFGER